MQEQRCTNPHPRKPGPCNAQINVPVVIAVEKSFGSISMECWRCSGPITLDFESEGTEAVDKEPIHV